MIEKEKLFDLVEKIPFAKQFGIELLEISEGRAKGRLKLSEKTQNMYGGMHGGCSFTLADTIAGLSACTYGKYVTTVTSTMNYLRPIKDTGYVLCEANAVRQGNKIAVYEIRLLGDEGQIFGTGSFTYYVLDQEI